MQEVPLCFECQSERLIGIVHQPHQCQPTGVLIVVGGPQYRVGSHRQFLLLARYLADNGIPVMRFDYRAMGDSEGENVNFENVNQDIASAINQFIQQVPEIKQVVLWGLCDAASASLFYAYTDPRVTGIVLLNPWVRTVAGQAKAYLKHYYLQRLIDKGFWKKLFGGAFDFRASLISILKLSKDMRAGDSTATSDESLPNRMLRCLCKFNGKILLILSGDDLTADEFREVVNGSNEWRSALHAAGISKHTLEKANHTFSRKEWRNQVELWTHAWIQNEFLNE